MGALPNYQPQLDPTRKPAAKARKAKPAAEKCAARTLPQIQAEFRARTNYSKGTGYFPVFHALFEDLLRLSSGLACTNLILVIFQDLSIRSAGTHNLPAEAEMSIPELALRVRCDERQINRVLAYLQERKMVTVRRLEGSRIVIALHFEKWGSIALDYEQWDQNRREAEQTEEGAQEETADQETLQVKEGTVPLTKAPVTCKPGTRSKPIKVETGVRSLRIHWEHKTLDLTFSAVVTSGELILTGNAPEIETLKSKSHANRTESTRSRHTSGHGSPNRRILPTNEGSKKSPPSRVEHPRAEELAKLFDPLIFGHVAQTLSGDPRFHLQACEAIQDTPHDFMVKVAIERGARVLRPSHVPSLCRQIAHDYRKGKEMPAVKNLPTRDEIDAMIAAEEKQRKQKRGIK